MIKLNVLNTPIRIERPTSDQIHNSYGEPLDSWETVGDEVMLCEWKNAYGSEVWQAKAIHAKEPATLRMWYIEGVTNDCRIIMLGDNAVYDIISIDNVENRGRILELKVQRTQ